MDAKRFNDFAYRIVNGDELVGFALQMSDDSWGAFNCDDKRLTKRKFEKPKDVAEWFALSPTQGTERP